MSLLAKRRFCHDYRCEADWNDEELLAEARAGLGNCRNLYGECGKEGKQWRKCSCFCNCRKRAAKAKQLGRVS